VNGEAIIAHGGRDEVHAKGLEDHEGDGQPRHDVERCGVGFEVVVGKEAASTGEGDAS